MVKYSVFYNIQEYPIDSIPLDINEYIKVYKPAIKFILDFGIESFLSLGKELYDLNYEYSLNEKSIGVFNGSISYVVNTGGYDDRLFVPKAYKTDLWNEHLNVAVTDIDKSLVGWIITCTCYNRLKEEIYSKNAKELLYSFIKLLHNVQSYELRTQTTVDLSATLDVKLVSALLFSSHPIENHSKLINLSESAVNDLNTILANRERAKTDLLKARILEKEFVCNEENEYYWELFIKCLNLRCAEEQRVTELIYSDIGIDIKIHEFEEYLKKIIDYETVIPEVGISLSELFDKINERERCARNYMWAKTDDGKIVHIHNSISSILVIPFSFNCVLIAYHAFLLKRNEEMLRAVITSTCFFIIRNLSEISDTIIELESCEELLLYVNNLIFDFYDDHRTIIDTLRFNSILTEDSLSGADFNGDIIKLLFEKERENVTELDSVIESLDFENEESLFSIVKSYSKPDAQRELKTEIDKQINSFVPNKSISMEELVEKETSKRLVVTINAIYILVQTIERALPLDLFNEKYREEIDKARRRLAKLEAFLVKTTYTAPDFYCFEKTDLDMDGYRIINGIDAADIEKNNEKAYQRSLFNLAKTAIKDLHNEIDNLDFEKACQIKEELRNKMKDYPNCELKEQIYELVDQETYCLCDALMLSSSNSNEFEDTKSSLKAFLGEAFVFLPDGTINALTTAELLFSRYATPKYSNANFDYSCISSLYYQGFESLYNELIWSKYADKLNNIKDNGNWFSSLYIKGNLPQNLMGYLPSVKPDYYMNKEKTRIASVLTMGSFKYLLYNATSSSPNSLPDFRVFLDKTFGFDVVSNSSEEYKTYQKRIDELYDRIKKAIPQRNAASHGQNAISLEECKSDKKIVLSDLDSIRNNYLGLIMLFLSLYRET